MSDPEDRIDEVEKYYEPISKSENAITILFWVIAITSIFIPYANEILSDLLYELLIALYIVLVLTHFSLSQFLRLNLIPKAEIARRKQLLSDSFGTSLTHDKTNLYYNNKFTPSLERLAANVMENAFFSKNIASRMLLHNRTITGIYIAIFIVIFIIRHDNLDLIIWITQLVFSGEIVAKWLRLEMLRSRHEKVYDELYSFFLHGLGSTSNGAIATVLNTFADYESAKSAASTKLSSKIFHKLNPTLTKEWKVITRELNMANK